MKKFGLILSLVFLLVFTSLVSAVPFEIGACETLDMENRTYVLNQSVSIDPTNPDDVARGFTCFVINAKNITLDGNGFNITGNGTGVGVSSDGHDNIVIKDFAKISGFDNGIALGESIGSEVSEVVVSSNNFIGLYLFDLTNSDFSNISILDNGDKGVYLFDSFDNTFSDITSNSNEDNGFLFDDVSGNTFTDITANSNGGSGISLDDSDSNLFSDITTNLNEFLGISLRDSRDNTFSRVFADSNGLYGVNLNDVSGNIFSDFLISDTISKYGSQTGLLLKDGLNNSFTNITSNGNEYGLEIKESINNTFTDITSDSNSMGGIRLLSGSDFNEFQDIFTDSNYYFSFKIEESNYAVVKNLVSSDSWHSVLIDEGSFNSFSNLTTTSISKWSIRLQKDCSENSFDLIYAQSNANVVDDGSDSLINGFNFVNGSNQVHYNNDYGEVFSDNSSGLVFGEEVKVGSNLLSVDSVFNGRAVSANVTLRNVSLTGAVMILKNGAECTDCTMLLENQTAGRYTFNILEWANYSLAERPSVTPASTGGSNSGSGGYTETCEEWTVCVDEEQTQSCNDGTVVKTRSCVVEEEAPEEEEPVEDVPEDETFFSAITGAVIGAGRVAQAGLALLLILIVVGLYFLVSYLRKRK